MIEMGLDQPEAQGGCPVAFTYTEDEVRELLLGFTVLELKQDQILPFVVEKYVSTNTKSCRGLLPCQRPCLLLLRKTLMAYVDNSAPYVILVGSYPLLYNLNNSTSRIGC